MNANFTPVRKRKMLSIMVPAELPCAYYPTYIIRTKENTISVEQNSDLPRKIRSNVWLESEREGQEFRLAMPMVGFRALYLGLCPRSVRDLSCKRQSLFSDRFSFCESPQLGLQWLLWLCRLLLGLCLPQLFRLVERDSY